MRKKLPTRRQAESFRIDTPTQRFVCTAGFDNKTGDLQELFFTDRARVGSGLDDVLYDMGVLVSLALQYGVDKTELLRSLCKDADGKAASPIGQALEKAEAIEEEHKGTLQALASLYGRGNDNTSL
jgi:hypothetical protein|tara:strand:- start:5833 stop:6210 length:378 start_codon:yes stop_codon:yes gene_type:complete